MPRNVCLSALVGSHNYNLNDEFSDEDYKYFVVPTFDDIYNSKYHTESSVSEKVDYTVHDVRKLKELLWKSNINFLEVLFSKHVVCDATLKPLLDNKEEIATMNLPYLYSACKGMHFEKMKNLCYGTSNTQNLVVMYGYDTKNAMHAYRVLDFCMRMLEYNFDFEKSMKYDDPGFLLGLKRGVVSLDDFKSIVKEKFSEFEKIESYFKEKPVKEDVREFVSNTVLDCVKFNMLNELELWRKEEGDKVDE